MNTEKSGLSIQRKSISNIETQNQRPKSAFHNRHQSVQHVTPRRIEILKDPVIIGSSPNSYRSQSQDGTQEKKYVSI